ncbi:hypothetical protein [Streptomyces sp. NPDC093984]|uniref:hypothetical protein n=1 Tax=Streptomyces sp. NPDC093984 TaxID=3366052 RepID=UPI00381C1E54
MPELAGVPPEPALDRALWWIDRPRDSSAWLWLVGKEGAGKTELLREIAERQVDAEADLRSWLARIDPDAYAAQCRQRVFEDYDFADRQ